MVNLREFINIVERADAGAPNIDWFNISDEDNAEAIVHMVEWGYRHLGLKQRLTVEMHDTPHAQYHNDHHLILIPSAFLVDGHPQFNQKFLIFHELAHARQHERGWSSYTFAGDIATPHPPELQGAKQRYPALAGIGGTLHYLGINEWTGPGGPSRWLIAGLSDAGSRLHYDVIHAIKPGEHVLQDLRAILARGPVVRTGDDEYLVAYAVDLPWEGEANTTAQRMVREYDREFGGKFA